MSKVVIDIGMSLDGCTPEANGRPRNPLGDGGPRIHDWMFQQAVFAPPRATWLPDAPDNDFIARIFTRAQAQAQGRNMFDEGEVSWPEEATFRTPVFALAHTHARGVARLSH